MFRLIAQFTRMKGPSDAQHQNRSCHTQTADMKSSFGMVGMRTENKAWRVNVAAVSFTKRLQHSLIEMASQLWLICVTPRSCGCSFLRRASAPHPLGRGGSPAENFIFSRRHLCTCCAFYRDNCNPRQRGRKLITSAEHDGRVCAVIFLAPCALGIRPPLRSR